eukprot:6914221-Pyramimonas_sp.AAC.1
MRARRSPFLPSSGVLIRAVEVFELPEPVRVSFGSLDTQMKSQFKEMHAHQAAEMMRGACVHRGSAVQVADVLEAWASKYSKDIGSRS